MQFILYRTKIFMSMQFPYSIVRSYELGISVNNIWTKRIYIQNERLRQTRNLCSHNVSCINIWLEYTFFLQKQKVILCEYIIIIINIQSWEKNTSIVLIFLFSTDVCVQQTFLKPNVKAKEKIFLIYLLNLRLDQKYTFSGRLSHELSYEYDRFTL